MISLLTLASDPDVGSVRQYAANRLPAARSGMYLVFCSSVPYNSIPL